MSASSFTEFGMALAGEGIDVDTLPYGHTVTASDLENTDLVIALPVHDYPSADGDLTLYDEAWTQAEIDIRFIFGKQISLIGSTMGSHQDFQDVLEYLWSGKIKPVIHQVMPLSEGCDAYKMMEEGKHFGKMVLAP